MIRQLLDLTCALYLRQSDAVLLFLLGVRVEVELTIFGAGTIKVSRSNL